MDKPFNIIKNTDEIRRNGGFMSKKKRVVAVMLAALMAVSAVGCGDKGSETPPKENTPSQSQEPTTQETDELSWLNTSGTLPLVEEGTEKGLSMAVRMNEDSAEPEETWAYRFITEAMNIDLEVTKFTASNSSEYLSLLFADSELPDVIIGGGFTAQDLVKYGASEGQIIDLAPYITEELTPNLYQLYQEHPEYLDAVQDSEGHIWSLGYVNDPTDRGQVARAFFNYDWLDEVNMEPPTTVDELLEVLRAFKTLGDDVIPMGGSYSANNPGLYLLNAFGYHTTDAKGLKIARRNGEVVLPVADREAYGAYLTLLHTMYEEGLIHPDFYTMDGPMTNAVVAEGRTGFIAQAPFVYTTEFDQWWGAIPLTSEYNEKAFWPASTSSVSAGQFVISSSCQDVELAMAFADWMFGSNEDERVYGGVNYNYNLLTSGPVDTQTEYLYGVKGYSQDEKGNSTYIEFEENSSMYASVNDYLYQNIQLIGFTTLGLPMPTDHTSDPDLSGYTDVSDVRKSEELAGNGELTFRMGLQETVCNYVETGLPNYVYLDPETMEEAANLLVVISEYATQETAKFVTGARPLSELDAYFDEIERLGALDYVEIYRDYYNSLQ